VVYFFISSENSSSCLANVFNILAANKPTNVALYENKNEIANYLKLLKMHFFSENP
jgi:hypothetical protein